MLEAKIAEIVQQATEQLLQLPQKRKASGEDHQEGHDEEELNLKYTLWQAKKTVGVLLPI